MMLRIALEWLLRRLSP